MKEKNDFDFEKHYGDEKETPPASFWDDLEKQLPKKRKKRAAIFWLTGSLGLAAAVALLVWGVSSYTSTKSNETVTADKQDNTNINPPKTSTNKTEEESNNIDNAIAEERETSATTNNNSTGKKENTKNNPTEYTQGVRAYTGNKGNTGENKPTNDSEITKGDNVKEHKETEPSDEHGYKPEHKHEEATPNKPEQENTDDEPIDDIPVLAKGDVGAIDISDTNSTTTPSPTETKQEPEFNFYAAASGFAHTHTFSKFGSGYKLGIGIGKAINNKLEARAYLGYLQVNKAGLQRSSYSEHYFVTKTTILQELDVSQLQYVTANFSLYYTLNKTQLFGGVETMFLTKSKASMRTTEVSYSEERVTEQNDIENFNSGVNNIVPQFVLGASRELTDKISVQAQLSHPILPFVGQSLFSNSILSYLGVGINLKLKN